MPSLDDGTIKELKSQKVVDLLEEIVTNAALDVLSRLAQQQKLQPSLTCYKTNCPSRVDIHF